MKWGLSPKDFCASLRDMNSGAYRTIIGCLLVTAASTVAQPIKTLLLDGQNNHDWKSTTPVLRKILVDSGLFTVDVATSPGQGGGMIGFRPEGNQYRVILSNYSCVPGYQ